LRIIQNQLIEIVFQRNLIIEEDFLIGLPTPHLSSLDEMIRGAMMEYNLYQASVLLLV
jgi:hypothetical protein